MYIHGGWDGTKTLDDMYEFSMRKFIFLMYITIMISPIVTCIWYKIMYYSELIPPSMYRHTSIAIGDEIIIFGGIDDFNQKYNELFVFNVVESLWSILTPGGKYPSKRTFHNMLYHNNRILIMGGYSNIKVDDCYSLLYYERFYTNYKIKGKKLESQDKSTNKSIFKIVY